MPSEVKRFTESCGEMSLRSLRMRSMTFPKSTSVPGGTFTPNSPGIAHGGCGAGGADDGFRGDTTDIEAIAAHEVALDQRDLRAETGCRCGGNESGGACTDDDEVVFAGGRGIDPIGGMDVGDELLVVRVFGEHGGGVVGHKMMWVSRRLSVSGKAFRGFTA